MFSFHDNIYQHGLNNDQARLSVHWNLELTYQVIKMLKDNFTHL